MCRCLPPPDLWLLIGCLAALLPCAPATHRDPGLATCLHSWLSFLTGKAVANRLVFHSQLLDLLRAQQSGDGVDYVSQASSRAIDYN